MGQANKTLQLMLLAILGLSACTRSAITVGPIAGNLPSTQNPSLNLPYSSGFNLANNLGGSVPVQDHATSKPPTMVLTSEQAAFMSSMDPWNYLYSQIPESLPGVGQGALVVPAGLYQLVPTADVIGASYQITVSAPVTLGGAPGCNGNLSGQVVPGLVICLNFAPTLSPTVIPIQIAVQGYSGATNSVLYVLIIPAAQNFLFVGGMIPAVQVNAVSNSDGVTQSVTNSTFVVTGSNLPVGTILQANDPTAIVVPVAVPEGSGWRVTTKKRGPLILTAVDATTGHPVATIQPLVALNYQMTVKGFANLGMGGLQTLNFSCDYEGAPTPLSVGDGNGKTLSFNLKAQDKIVTPDFSRNATDLYGRAQVSFSGDPGAYNCKVQVFTRLFGTTDLTLPVVLP